MFQFSSTPSGFGPVPPGAMGSQSSSNPFFRRRPSPWTNDLHHTDWEDADALCTYTDGDGHRQLTLAPGQSVEIEILPLIPGAAPPDYRLEWAGDTARLHLDDGGSIRLDNVTRAGRLTVRVMGKLRLLQDAPIDGTATAAEVETTAA